MASNIYDLDYTQASQHGTQRKFLPFSSQGDQSSLVYEIDYMQRVDMWTPSAVNSLCPLDSAAFLVEETTPKPIGNAGMVLWTRRYAHIPATRNVGASLSYQFPGLTLTSTLRIPYVWTVSSRTQLDYYLVGPGSPYAGVLNIPIIERQRYYQTPAPSGSIGTDVTTLFSAAVSPSTNPTTETYLAWITSSFEIVAEASVLRLWQGNIWERATKYIIAR